MQNASLQPKENLYRLKYGHCVHDRCFVNPALIVDFVGFYVDISCSSQQKLSETYILGSEIVRKFAHKYIISAINALPCHQRLAELAYCTSSIEQFLRRSGPVFVNSYCTECKQGRMFPDWSSKKQCGVSLIVNRCPILSAQTCT